jgi:transposase-like protein
MPRTFTREYKLRMVAEYEAATEPGAKGALIRREGLYQSNIRKWREARDAGRLASRREDQAAASRKNSRNTSTEMKRLQEENTRLVDELKKSRAVVEVMGKTYALLEMLSESAD